METIWRRLDGVSDERTKGWMLVDSPGLIVLLLSLYWLMVWRGPKIMQNRGPLNVIPSMSLYNLFMCFLNAYIFFELLAGALNGGYSFQCQPSRPKNKSENELRVAKAVWLYFLSKPIEFLDTLFFILRKKSNQLTVLHIYHHSSVFVVGWLAVKWTPTGSSFFAPMINCFIHVIMYSYYGLTLLGSRYQKYLWWKKYLTVLQLIQFVITLIWSVFNLFGSSAKGGFGFGFGSHFGFSFGCDFPKWPHFISVFYMTSFLVLFGKFYAKSYHRKRD
ncbi:ELOVL4 family protein [Megaselia abdita]